MPVELHVRSYLTRNAFQLVSQWSENNMPKTYPSTFLDSTSAVVLIFVTVYTQLTDCFV